MIATLLIPILVAGFFACHIHPVESYRLHRYEGQYLYLKSAELGFKCFAIACAMLAALYGVCRLLSWAVHLLWGGDAVGTLERAWSAIIHLMQGLGAETPAKANEQAWIFLLSLLTWGAAYVLKAFALRRLGRRFGQTAVVTAIPLHADALEADAEHPADSDEKGLTDARAASRGPRKTLADLRVHVIGEILQDSPLDRLLFRLSLEKDKFAMLVMNDRKVYVGKVIDLGEPSATSGMDQDILIIPLMSGYRDKDTLKVHFTTHYSEVDASIHLALRQDAIVSVTEFDFRAYRQWNPPLPA